MKRYVPALLLYGANGVVASFIALESGQIVLLRCVLGSLTLLALFYLGGGRLSGLGDRRDLALLAVSGAAMAADWLLLYEAYARIGVGLPILINYTGPPSSSRCRRWCSEKAHSRKAVLARAGAGRRGAHKRQGRLGRHGHIGHSLRCTRQSPTP